MLLFLSYADEDSAIAREIADHLSSEDISVYSTQDDAGNLDLTAAEPECAILGADAFLALLSPSFLASATCRRERELALLQEQANRGTGTETDFVRVLQIRDTPYHQAASLRSRPWFDLTGRATRELVLKDLASNFGPSAKLPRPAGQTPPAGARNLRRPSPHFRNRDQELAEVYHGVTNEDSEHFWVLIAPPQLGKSWFLDQIADRIDKSWRGRWVIKLVDARDLPTEMVEDADAILRLMFGLEPQAATETDAETIAASISKNNRFHLCLLDSAELLDERVVRQLRQHLSEINEGVAQTRNSNARLALVAATRSDRGWKGVTPGPRLEIRRLTEFKVEVIYDALQKLAREMNRPFTAAELEQLAARVQQLSEGLPALLVGCLNWIREREWTGLSRLEDQATFEEIARPYIEDALLSPSSLRTDTRVQTAEKQAAIKQALKVLSPYRFFTLSHLSRHTQDGEWPDVLGSLQMSVQDLWAAVSGTDLLYRPLREPWLEIYAPIRRLLCRHWYPSTASRSQAHREARDFLQSFIVGQSGSDQSAVLVECLWHEAQAVILVHPQELGARLTSLARELSGRLTPSPAFNEAALRDHAAWCMTNDQEFADAVSSVRGLFDQLVEAVMQPT